MKLKKIITISICALLVIGASVFIGLYSYGAVTKKSDYNVNIRTSAWDKYQRAFVDDYYGNLKTSKEVVEEYVKFNSATYCNHTQNIKIYNDDLTTFNEEYSGLNEIKLDDFTIALYTTMSDGDYNKYDYSLYFYGIDNTEVNMGTVVVVSFPVISGSGDYLTQSIENYKSKFLVSNPDSPLDSIYLEDSMDYLSKNNFFDTGDLLYDLDGKSRIVSGGAVPARLYSWSMLYSFSEDENRVKFLNMKKSNFAIFELSYEVENNEKIPSGVKTLCVGQIDNVSTTKEEYAENNTVLNGYGLEIIPALKAVGYNSYVRPYIVRNVILTFIVASFLAVMAYLTVLNNWKKDKKEEKKKSSK